MQNQPITGESKIDLTPMLDVVFIMLIFFVVTATFVQEVGIDANPPDPDAGPPPPELKTILVRIGSNDQLVVAGDRVDITSIRAHIERLHAQNPDAPVIIQPHPNSSTKVIVRVMDSAREAGIYGIKLANTVS